MPSLLPRKEVCGHELTGDISCLHSDMKSALIALIVALACAAALNPDCFHLSFRG